MNRDRLKLMLLIVVLALIAATRTPAQLPFYTDAANITPKRMFHIEFFNEYSQWYSTSRSVRFQNA